jgi:hypothetical protein
LRSFKPEVDSSSEVEMAEDERAAYLREVEEAIKGVPLEEEDRKLFLDLLAKLERDDVALIVLKGHLVIEERITAAIEKFMWNGDYVDDVGLRFAQKVALARAISMDHSAHSMWTLIEKLNTLRNKLAHSLEGEPRARAMQGLREAFKREVTDPDREELADDKHLVASVIAMCLGWVHRFEQEVERFKDLVGEMDRAINPHRYNQKEEPGPRSS